MATFVFDPEILRCIVLRIFIFVMNRSILTRTTHSKNRFATISAEPRAKPVMCDEYLDVRSHQVSVDPG